MTMIDVTLGIDIGGTNTVLGFVDKNGKCIAVSSIPTKSNESAGMLFSRLHLKIDELYSTICSKYKMAGICIGAPNANYFKGTVELPPNLNWGIVYILEIVKKYYDVPSAITNDANAEAIILFGGLALAGDLIFAPTKKYMEESMLNIFKNKVKLLPSALPGGNAAVLGAAALIWNELKR